MDTGPGHPDVEQTPLLLDRGLVRRRRAVPKSVTDRQGPVDQPHQEDGVPLEPLRRVQRRQGHALHGRWVPRLGPRAQLGEQAVEVQLRHLLEKIGRQRDESPQRRPLLARLRAGGLGGRQPLRGQHGLDEAHHARPPTRVLRKVVTRRRGPDGRHGRAHVRTLEEALPAPHLVRDLEIGQRLLVRLGLGVDAIEHRDLGRPHTVTNQALHGPRDTGGLRHLVVVLDERRRRPRRTLTHQLQAGAGDTATRGPDDLIGQFDNLGRGAVVPLEPDHGGLREATGEVQEVLRGGPGEGVDGLVRVTDHREIVPLAHPCIEHALLQRRDVLVFVDHEAAVALAELLCHRRAGLERGRGVQQEIVEIEQDGVGIPVLELLVPLVHRGHPVRVRRRVPAQPRHRGGVVLRGDQGGLGPLDLPGEVPDAVRRGRGSGGRRRLADHAELVVEQPPLRGAHDLRPEVLELTHGRSVERPRLHLAAVVRDAQQTQALTHLPGRAGGERDRQHLARFDVATRHQMGDPAGDGPSLARSGAGEHAHGAAGGQYGSRLLGVESFHGVGCGHPAIMSAPSDRNPGTVGAPDTGHAGRNNPGTAAR